MKKILIIFCIIVFTFITCKKTDSHTQHNNSNNKISDTLTVNEDNCYIVFKWDLEEIDNYKATFKDEEDYYTIMDDVNYYTAEGEECLKKSGLKKITVSKKQYKYIKFHNNTLKVDTLKFFEQIMYKKHEKPKIVQPIDLTSECNNFSKEILPELGYNPISAFTPQNYTVLAVVEYDWDGDKIQDKIIVYDSIPSTKGVGIGKRPLIALKGKGKGKGKGNNQYELWFRNNDAIPCRSCSGSADPDIELKIEDGNLQYRDVSLISSTIKNIGYSFDKNLNLARVDVDIENSGTQEIKKIISKTDLPKVNLKTINLKKVEKEILSY